jgi:cyclophilin family peptidyl-prolyl cis-trans isomerase
MLGMRFDHSGRLAVANTGAPDSGACQFFITADLVPEWNDKYTIFGQVVRGLDVVEAISRAPLHGDKPVNPAKLLNVTIFRVMPKGR